VIANNLVTSANELPGYRISRNLGIVRGINRRSRLRGIWPAATDGRLARMRARPSA
jgi:hypothetical protein